MKYFNFYTLEICQGSNGGLYAYVRKNTSNENLLHCFKRYNTKIGNVEIKTIGINLMKTYKEANEICEKMNEDWKKEGRYFWDMEINYRNEQEEQKEQLLF